MSSIPRRSPRISPEDHFKRFFPNNVRLTDFTADEQFQLLYRAYLLCTKSNRANEFRLTSLMPNETFVYRNKNSVCCHPIFIDHELFKAKRHLLVKPVFIFKLMVKNHMLQILQDTSTNVAETTTKVSHKRHPTYPEDFKVGDLLKVVVPNEYYGESQRYRVAPTFESEEGCFRWLITDKHPHGYPYRLSEGLDENLSVFEFEI